MIHMIDADTLDQITQRLIDAAPQGSQIILFGSFARGQAGPDSDLDFLVIEPEVKDRHGEMVRLRDAIRPIPAPVDILVTTRATFEKWREMPNSALYQAAKEGRVVHGDLGRARR